MNPTIEMMAAHIMAICAANRIGLTWCDRPIRAEARTDLRSIRIAPIRSVVSYATALHEIGHLLGDFQQIESVMISEEWAWAWARSHALFWTERMERLAADSLDWYRPRASQIDAWIASG